VDALAGFGSPLGNSGGAVRRVPTDNAVTCVFGTETQFEAGFPAGDCLPSRFLARASALSSDVALPSRPRYLLFFFPAPADNPYARLAQPCPTNLCRATCMNWPRRCRRPGSKTPLATPAGPPPSLFFLAPLTAVARPRQVAQGQVQPTPRKR
jgi:hypothetical protein